MQSSNPVRDFYTESVKAQFKERLTEARAKLDKLKDEAAKAVDQAYGKKKKSSKKNLASLDAAQLAAIKKPQTKSKIKPVKEADKSYSAKKASAGKDIGKPGKNFEKIAKTAEKKYGSTKRGEKVAGAVLAKLRKG